MPKAPTKASREQLDRIRALLASITAIDPARAAVGPKLDEETVAQLEEARGIRLPAPYREYLLAIGDGGAGFAHGGLPAFAADASTPPSALKPFVLTGPWSDPAQIDEWKAEGQYTKNKKRFYELPEGASPIDGTLPFGHTKDHSLYVVVLAGRKAGSVWIDSRGVDLGGLDPADPPSFLDLQIHALEEQLATLEQDRRIDRAIAEGKATTLFEGIEGDALRALKRKVKGKAERLLAAAYADPAADRASASRAAATLFDALEDPRGVLAAIAASGDGRALVDVAQNVRQDPKLAHLRDLALVYLTLGAARIGDDVSHLAISFQPSSSFLAHDAARDFLRTAPRAELLAIVAHLPGPIAIDILLPLPGRDEAVTAAAIEAVLRGVRTNVVTAGNAARALRSVIAAEREREAAVAASILDGLVRALAFIEEDVFDTVIALAPDRWPNGNAAKTEAEAWLRANVDALAEDVPPNTYAAERLKALRR